MAASTFYLLRPTTKTKDANLNHVLICYTCPPLEEKGKSSKFKYNTGVEVIYTPPTEINKEGQRVTVKGKMGTGDWNNKTKMVKPSDPLAKVKNEKLETYKKMIDEIILNLGKEMKPITSNAIREGISIIKASKRNIDENKYIYPYFKNLIHDTIRKENTQYTYVTFLNIIEKYEKHLGRYAPNQIRFDELNASFFRKFIKWLEFSSKRKDKVMTSTLTIYYMKFKRLCRLAMESGVLVDNSFLNFSLKDDMKMELVKQKFVYLTLDELDQIYDLRNHPEKFGCHQPAKVLLEIDRIVLDSEMGMRWVDRKKIVKENFTFQEDGIITLETTEQKRKKKIAIPLTKRGKEILMRYDYTFPPTDCENVNRWIKKICRIAGINELIRLKGESVEINGNLVEIEGKRVEKWKLVTTHTTRRSMITNALSRGVPATIIKKVTGQTELQIYSYNHQTEIEGANAFLKIIEGKAEKGLRIVGGTGTKSKKFA